MKFPEDEGPTEDFHQLPGEEEEEPLGPPVRRAIAALRPRERSDFPQPDDVPELELLRRRRFKLQRR